MLEINNLVKSYDKSGFKLSIPQFKVKEGSITGLIGPNGAGKTTLIKLIVKLLYPNQGQINLIGQNITEDLIIKNISYMPGHKNLYEDMTVSQMLAFTSYSVVYWNKDKTKTLLDRFPLPMAKKISTLSYGEKTQLYAILTFSKDVPFLILDEPTQGLDPIMQERMLSLLKEESSQAKTILFSSHQLNEVEETADTIAIIKSGQLIVNDVIDDLKEKLYMLVTDKAVSTNGLDILTRRQAGEKTILIGLKNQPHLPAELQALEVNLKDIFLNVIEGEVQHEFIC